MDIANSIIFLIFKFVCNFRAIEICRISDACRVRNSNEFEIGIQNILVQLVHVYVYTCIRVLLKMATAKRKRLSLVQKYNFEKFGFNEPSLYGYIEQNFSVPSECVKMGVHCIYNDIIFNLTIWSLKRVLNCLCCQGQGRFS